MARLFISHSSRNNDRAVEVRNWLAANGWDDVFLDLDPERGIAAGERWKDALQKAAQRCEMVLALISAEWLASAWCKAEVDAARLMGKKVIVALIGIDKGQVPPDLTDEQWVDLTGDPNGYKRLKEGLRRGGLDPSSFPFEAGRRPYPGFAFLDERDAAIFFGRDAQIVRGLDKMRGLVRSGVDRMLVVLGASGSGKSSFFRAGLWPRLKRDDRTWLPLPTLRPERAVISGQSGLVQALYQTVREAPFADEARKRDLPRSRDAIRDAIATPEGLLRIFAALREIAQVPNLSGETAPPPTIVLAVDQGEELFNEDGRDEAARFIEIVAATLKADPHTLAIVVMRSDSFPQLQTEPRLADLPKETVTLDMMLEGSYRAVIEGPARLTEPPLKIDPQLTDALLHDVSGQDALPLLAFTLAHLYENYATDNALTLADYEKLGRLKGVIATTVRETFAEGVARGDLPRDAKAQLALARTAFIPHLARVNPAGQLVRRIATRAEIPAAARPLIDRFAERRLLIRDRRPLDGADVEVIEVAHEALLREWRELNEALLEEREFLAAKGQLEQDVADWKATPEARRSGALLSGNKLLRAQSWLQVRPQDLSAEEREFIKAGVTRKARLHSAMVGATVLAFAAVGGTAFIAWQQERAARLQADLAQAGRLAAQADLLRERGDVDDGALLAAEAVRLLTDRRTRSLEVDLSLRRALARLPRRLGGFEGSGDQKLELAADGRFVTVRSLADQVAVRQLPSGELQGCRLDDVTRALAAEGAPARPVLIQATSANGSHCATVPLDVPATRVIDLWSAAPLSRVASVLHAGSVHLALALSDDAEFLAVTDRAQSGDPDAGVLRLWSRTRNTDVFRQTGAEFIAFSPAGRLFATTKGIWRLPGPEEDEATPVQAWPRRPWFIAFDRSGGHVVTRGDYEGELEIWDVAKGNGRSASAPAGKPLALGGDGRLVVIDTVIDDAAAVLLWDLETGAELARLPVEALAAAFGEREVIVLTHEPDGSGQRFVARALQPPGGALAAVHARPQEHVLWAGLDAQSVTRLVHTGRTMRIESWPWRAHSDSWAWRSADVTTTLSVETPEPPVWDVSADHRHVAIAERGGVTIGPIDGSGPAKHVAMVDAPSLLTLSARGDVLGAARGSTTKVWRLGSNEHWTLRAPAAISALRVAADGRHVLAVVRAEGQPMRSGDPYQLLRWRLRAEAKPDVVNLGGHMLPPDLTCLLAEDGSSLMVGARRVDVGATIAGPAGSVEDCTTIKGEALQLTFDGAHLVVSDTRAQPVARLEHPAQVTHAAMSPDGRHAATLANDGAVRVWALDPNDLIAQMCRRGPRTLSDEARKLRLPAGASTDACGRE
jgi:hypothetical protein